MFVVNLTRRKGGEIHVTSPELELMRGSITGKAELLWKPASTSLTKVKLLGEYRLYLNGQGQTATLKL